MRPTAVALFSGGLDSILAIRLLQDQEIPVRAFNMILDVHPSFAGIGAPGANEDDPVERAAARLGVPLERCYRPDEYLGILKRPPHGYGKNMNPCIDCRIFLLKHAADFMRTIGAACLVTGEVVGERPMSQNRNTMRMIEKLAGLAGYVLRPLSAKLLAPTVPEQEGWVDRERLLDISGRSRKPQMALAEKYGISEYPSPAGGCLLTDPGFSARLRDLMRAQSDFDANDVNLLKVGRHFRMPEGWRAVVGRTHEDNLAILSLARPGDLILTTAEVPGPVTLCRGESGPEALRKAAALTARYSKARNQSQVNVSCKKAQPAHLPASSETILSVRPADPDELAVERIG